MMRYCDLVMRGCRDATDCGFPVFGHGDDDG